MFQKMNNQYSPKTCCSSFPPSFLFLPFLWAPKGAESYTFIHLSAEGKSFRKKNCVLAGPFQGGEGNTLHFQPAWGCSGGLWQRAEALQAVIIISAIYVNNHYCPEDEAEIHSVNSAVLDLGFWGAFDLTWSSSFYRNI